MYMHIKPPKPEALPAQDMSTVLEKNSPTIWKGSKATAQDLDMSTEVLCPFATTDHTTSELSVWCPYNGATPTVRMHDGIGSFATGYPANKSGNASLIAQYEYMEQTTSQYSTK
ncbi:hypothetical protein EDD18DRAFT_1115576 [Armillaria luteobubalina]|uniref:Uncharacterized protein n=1 Tax=Armillaria luteobubalina TaxID=153913 RepID=A0AA39UBI5_9AGAR|nr:hypothetical protein EDD18DRAFT_1115576 [Armillaria luteobubalina]